MSAEAIQAAIIQQLRNNTDVSAEFNTALTGTLTFTQTSSAVTGTNTLFTTELKVGDYIRAATSSTWYRVASIATNTSLTLSTNFAGATETGVTSKTSNISKGMGRNFIFKDDSRGIRVYLPIENWSITTLPNNKKQDVVCPFLLFIMFYEPDEDTGEQRKTSYNQMIRKALTADLLLGGTVYDSRIGDTRYYFHPMIEGSYYMVIPFTTKKKENLS